MTAKAALCLCLIKGEVLNIKNGFELLGITNVPREIGRSVERAFDVEVSRTPKEGFSRHGQPVVWVDYYLRKSERNQPGIKKMIEYCQSQAGNPKTTKQQKHFNTLKQLSFYDEI